MREVEVVILFPVEAEHVTANSLSCPVLGAPVPVTVNEAVNEGTFALSRVFLPEPDDLPPTETHKQTASALRLTAAEAVPVAYVDTRRNCRVVDADSL